MKRLLMMLLAGGMIANVQHAQNQQYTQADAAVYFNQSIELMKIDLPLAIQKLDSCLIICNLIGDSALEVRAKAEPFLCDLNLRYAGNLYYDQKQKDKALIAARNTLSLCEKYNNDEIGGKTKKLLGQIYASLGSEQFSTKAYDRAILAFDSAYYFDPSLYNMLLNKAIAYRVLKNTPAFTENIDKYITLASQQNDSAQVKKGQKMAIEYLRAEGSRANAQNKLKEAQEILTKALSYGEDKDVFYYLADVSTKLKKYNDAIEYAQKGLAMETGSAEDKAKYYYVLGTAYIAIGKKDDACDAFKNAAYGKFAQAAKAQMINNKCEK
ncbi:MAG: tetratricopeptide repeat protein [Bacteroidales bacterium]